MKHFILFLCIFAGCVTASAQRDLKDTIMGLHDNSNDITKAVYSLDGRRLITASLDRTVHFYEATNWIPIHTYSHYDEVTQVAISRDNSIIASASKDNILKVYFLDSAKMLEFEHEGPITGLAFDYGMRFLYTASSDGNIRPYDLRKGEYSKRPMALGMPVSAITVSHTNFIYAGLKNGEIKVLNNMGKEAKVLKGHTGEITSLHYVFYKNQSFLASSSEDLSIKVWDTKTYKELKSMKGHTWRINHVELSRDLKYVVSASNDGTSKIWEIATGAVIINIPSKGVACNTCSINEDNGMVATTSVVREPREFVVYLWNTDLAVKVPEKPVPPVKPEKPAPPAKPAPKK